MAGLSSQSAFHANTGPTGTNRLIANMNLFAISTILIFVSNVSMAIFVLLKGKDRHITLIFFLFCLDIAAWGIGGYKIATSSQLSQAFLWWQISAIPIILVPIFYFHFVINYLNLHKHRLLYSFYGLAFLFILIDVLSPRLFFPEFKIIFTDLYWVKCDFAATPIFTFFTVIFYGFIVAYSLSLLIKNYPHFHGHKRNQVKYFIVASLIGWIGAVANFFIGYGFEFYPINNFLIALYPIVMAYSIIRYNLLDIQIVIKKSIIYSLLIMVISISYIVLIVISEKLLEGMIGYSSITISAVTAFLLGILAFPLRNLIQEFVDKYFFRGSHLQISEENVLLRQQIAQSDKLKAIATLASGLAHEIKNPLTAIRTFTEHLPQKRNDPEFLEKFSRIVGKETTRMNDLINQLLDFAKPTPPRPRPTDIVRLINETLDFLNNQFVNKDIKVTRNLISGHKLINIDPAQIRQALLNIFLNAIEAMNAGGTLTVDVKLRTQDPSIKTSGSLGPRDAGAPLLIISIADTGPGIDKKDLPHIFDPFWSKKDGGTGLGLAITHQIISEHNGKIGVESQAGVGTKFAIELPFTHL